MFKIDLEQEIIKVFNFYNLEYTTEKWIEIKD